jgi:hypothetical protein
MLPLKAILIIKNGWNDETQVKKIGLNLVEAVEQCIKLTNNQDIEIVRDKLNCFPPINERDKGKDWKTSEFWLGYSIAQYIATTFTRMFSDRDNRNQILSSNL